MPRLKHLHRYKRCALEEHAVCEKRFACPTALPGLLPAPVKVCCCPKGAVKYCRKTSTLEDMIFVGDMLQACDQRVSSGLPPGCGTVAAITAPEDVTKHVSRKGATSRGRGRACATTSRAIRMSSALASKHPWPEEPACHRLEWVQNASPEGSTRAPSNHDRTRL
jgi:hypothetical protein